MQVVFSISRKTVSNPFKSELIQQGWVTRQRRQGNLKNRAI